MSALTLMLGAALATQAGAAETRPLQGPAGSQQGTIVVTPVATDVPGQTADVASGGAMDLDINEKKSELVLSYAFAARSQRIDIDGVTAEVLQDRINVELTLPLGGGDNLLTREAFDGLADGPSLSLSWTSFGTRSSDPWDMEQNPALPGLARRSARQCNAEVQAGTAEGYTAQRCDNGGLYPTDGFIRRFAGLTTADLNRALLSPVSGFGLEGTVGLIRFKYRTPVTLAENRDTEPQFSIRAYGILFPSDGVSMLTGSVNYENGYEAQDNQTLCRAVIADPNDDCVNAPPGPPENVETLQLELEYRRVFEPIAGLGRFAIAPRIAVDVLSNEYELELPIYLTPTSGGPLLPGVTISYDSRHDEVVFGLFLRRTFKFGS